MTNKYDHLAALEPSIWDTYISPLIYSPIAINHLLLVILCYVINTKAVALQVHCKKKKNTLKTLNYTNKFAKIWLLFLIYLFF